MPAWTAKRALAIAKDVVEGRRLPHLRELTPERVLQIAGAAARSKGFVEYADFQEEMLLEIFAGRKPSAIGYRLFHVVKVLQAHSWSKAGRPAKFYPPPELENDDDLFNYEPIRVPGEPLSAIIIRERR